MLDKIPRPLSEEEKLTDALRNAQPAWQRNPPAMIPVRAASLVEPQIQEKKLFDGQVFELGGRSKGKGGGTTPNRLFRMIEDDGLGNLSAELVYVYATG